jgi:hypothetical protein
MADTFANTVLLEARLWQQERMREKFDQRKALTQIQKVFLDGQNYIPELDMIKNATTQATSTLYLENKNYTVNTSKSCTPSGEVGSSNKVSLTWAQKGAAFKINKKQFQGNELSGIQATANAIYNAEKSIWYSATGMDAAMLAYLETNRTQVNALSAGTSGSTNTWVGAASYHVTVPNANMARFWNDMQADMAVNNYTGKLWDIGNTWFMAQMAHYSSQGAANSTNYAYQFDNIPAGIEFVPSNLVTSSGYNKYTHYVIPEGGVAALFWNDPLNRGGNKDEAGEWTIMESMLFPGIFYDVFIKNTCADTTNDGGATQDSVNTVELTLNYALTKQPISVSNETPIFKYQILTT